MSETFEAWQLEQRAEAAGRSVEDQRGYELGRERAEAAIKEAMSRPAPAAGFAPEPMQQLVPDQMRPLPRGDKGAWYRNTPAGMLAAVVSPPVPDEDAEEARKAREFADRHEYIYQRRPTATEARFAVARRSDGVFLSGDAKELGAVFRRAGLRLAVLDLVEPLPSGPAAMVVQPVTRG